MERRRSPRFEVQVPAIYGWLDESETERQDGGFTRDVSGSGAFIWCEGDCPPCGTTIRIALLFPAIEPTSRAWRLESTGHVVRLINDGPANNGFVATFDSPRTIEVLANSFR